MLLIPSKHGRVLQNCIDSISYHSPGEKERARKVVISPDAAVLPAWVAYRLWRQVNGIQVELPFSSRRSVLSGLYRMRLSLNFLEALQGHVMRINLNEKAKRMKVLRSNGFEKK